MGKLYREDGCLCVHTSVQVCWARMCVAAALFTIPCSVAAQGDNSIPRWDPQHPDLNPGARPLTALKARPTGAVATTIEAAQLFDLYVGRSAVAKGVGLMVRGSAPRGTVLLESALRARRPIDTDNNVLLDYRAMSSINHCWIPNARLLRRCGPHALCRCLHHCAFLLIRACTRQGHEHSRGRCVRSGCSGQS